MSSLGRRRVGGASRHLRARAALAVFGGAAALGWLCMVLPLGADPGGTEQVRAGPGASAVASPAGPGEEAGDGPVTADLVLPVAAAGTAGAAAVYARVRRRRRTMSRTTPAAAVEPDVPSAELERRGRRLLVETDDSVRTSAEELAFVAGCHGDGAARPFARALESARGELAAAFRLRQLLDDAADRLSAEDGRRALTEIVERCAGAGRRLDAQAPAFDQLRALERDPVGALEYAEDRFQELTDRVRRAGGALIGLGERYAPGASRPVADHVGQARERLVFATSQLNRTRQALGRGDLATAAPRLRAAEGAVHQADALVTAVDRLADELAAAVALLPGTLDDAAAHRTADGVVADVRRETAADEPYDPLDALRRLVGAVPGVGADGLPHEPDGAALRAAALLVADSAVAAARDLVTTRRGAVGSEARTRLAEAERHLVRARDGAPPPGSGRGGSPLAEARRAGLLAGQARESAEQDVRSYEAPDDGPLGDGLGAALLGGVLLAGGPGSTDGLRGPACYGGPATRRRRTVADRL
ncbi:hypothetical protein GCM10010145_07030 [Streptomyces ruber]|uniref:Fibrillarin n=2 Tax=Streptomyces TaxID=1883 RepID=A0A918B7D6_9ACTN|nr:hypothetical protein [Streptomyces ruber]GGQ41326.1 hypothetical protein GCM10010145_07030 [Streptomyces ruber]